MARLLQALIGWPWIAMTTRKKIRLLILRTNKGLAEMKALFEAGQVVPVIDGAWGLGDLPQAFRYFGEGRHKGKVVVTVDPPADRPRP